VAMGDFMSASPGVMKSPWQAASSSARQDRLHHLAGTTEQPMICCKPNLE